MLEKDMAPRGTTPRLLAAVLAGLAALGAYGGCYVGARAAHLLVRESPMCDPDRIVPGAGASPAVRVVFAPLVAAETAYWHIREAWR
jgi:hypothetical protein